MNVRFMMTQSWHKREPSAPNLSSQGAAVITALLHGVQNQRNQVWKRLLPVQSLVLSGCGRGLPSCQVCWLDSEEIYSASHITNDDPEEWGPWEADLRLRSPFTETKPARLPGTGGWPSAEVCMQTTAASSVCPAHLNFNNSLLKQLLS